MNVLYDSFRSQLLRAEINWPAMFNLGLVAWRGPYTFLETNAKPQDIRDGGGEVVVVSLPLLNPGVVTGGYAKTDTAILPNVPAGPAVTFLTLAMFGAVDDDTRLIAYIDEAEGLPFIPNGQDQPVQPDWLQLRGWFRP